MTTPSAHGLPRDDQAFVQLDMATDRRGTAGAILDLLASEPRRNRMQRSSRLLPDALRRKRCFAAMDRVMSSLGIAA